MLPCCDTPEIGLVETSSLALVYISMRSEDAGYIFNAQVDNIQGERVYFYFLIKLIK